MAYVQGCDMRGLLSFQVLWLLSKKSMHGDEIANEIEKRRGGKPKAGTIYPALKELSNSGLITGRKSGKLIIYSLTPQGKHVMKEAHAYFVRCFGEMLSR